MDIKIKPTLAEKQVFWAEQLPKFEAAYLLPSHFKFVVFDMDQGNYAIKDDLGADFENDALEILHRVNTGWAMWKKAINFSCKEAAKAQVPEGFVLVPESNMHDHYIANHIKGTTYSVDVSELTGNDGDRIYGKLRSFDCLGSDGNTLIYDLGSSNFNLVKTTRNTGDFVWVEKKNTEDWYLDEDEGMWMDHDGIDGSLCELGVGEVQAVEHKEYLITESNTLYAAKVWDYANDHVDCWQFFKTQEEAKKTAAYCKKKFNDEPVEAQEQKG